jgi:hypothetical protein
LLNHAWTDFDTSDVNAKQRAELSRDRFNQFIKGSFAPGERKRVSMSKMNAPYVSQPGISQESNKKCYWMARTCRIGGNPAIVAGARRNREMGRGGSRDP